MSSLNPVFSVGFQIGEVLREHLGLAGAAVRKRALELLAEVGIGDPQTKLDAYPFQLSGGQQQRVMIAMAIACEPKLLIADEPTTALDVTIQRQIIELLARLRSSHGMAMLFITHDLALVSEIAEHVVVMREGEIREQGPAAALLRAPQDAYTRALLKVDAKGAMPYKRRIQIVFQNPYASLNPRFTVAQLLAEPMQIHGIGADDGERRRTAVELLGKVGLPADALGRYPHEFSGG